jgi:hypothetical protein
MTRRLVKGNAMLGSKLDWNSGYPDKGLFVAFLSPGFGHDQLLLLYAVPLLLTDGSSRLATPRTHQSPLVLQLPPVSTYTLLLFLSISCCENFTFHSSSTRLKIPTFISLTEVKCSLFGFHFFGTDVPIPVVVWHVQSNVCGKHTCSMFKIEHISTLKMEAAFPSETELWFVKYS